MSKLEETDTEINGGDVENNAYSYLSQFEENEDSSDCEDVLSTNEDQDLTNPKEFRDIAEGKNLNNSFLGTSYPENWDHLHFDKGSNP